MTLAGQPGRLEGAAVGSRLLRPKAAMLMKLEVLRRVLGDLRSGQVVFVSHCTLNQNVRYRGGATRPGAVDEVVARLQRAGVGIVQMPCPEQRAWGGVDKRYTMPAYGTDDFNRRVSAAHARPGQGLFIAALRRQLRRRGLDVPFDEHDLIAEITR